MGSKTYVNAVTARLLETENFKSYKDFGIARYQAEQRQLLRPSLKSTSLSECIRDAETGSMALKFKRAYNYAKVPGNYVYGVPKSSLSTDESSRVKAGAKSYLDGLEGSTVSIIYEKLNSKIMYHYAWKALYEDYLYLGYNNELKALSVQYGTPCYLKSSQLTMTQVSADSSIQDGIFEQFGLAMSYGSTPNRVQDTKRVQPDIVIGSSDKLTIVFVYENGLELLEGTVEIELSHVIPVVSTSNTGVIEQSPNEAEFLQIMYEVGGVYKLFTYEYESGKIPEIDQVEIYQEAFGQYYPRIYVRENADDIVTSYAKDNIRRVHSEKMMKKIGLDLKEITDSLNASIEDKNNDFKTTFLHLTVSINKEKDDTVSGKYLYNYFNTLYLKGTAIANNKREHPILDNERTGFKQIISDNNYTQELDYWKSGKRVVSGVATNNVNSPLKVNQYCVKTQVKGINVTGFKSNFTGVHELIFQNSSTQYTVITVANLKMYHKVSGHTVKCEWDDEQLSIPLDVSTVDSLKSKERELLMNRSLQVTITTKQVIKKKWYEKGPFKILMAAISIAINFVVPGSGFVLAALLQSIAITIVISIAVKIAMNLIVKLAIMIGVSPEVLGIIAVLAAIAYTVVAGKVDPKLFNAKELLKNTSYALDIYNKSIAKSIEGIKGQMDDFTKYSKDQNQKLKDAQAMLNTGVIPAELMLLTSPMQGVDIIFGETAEEFYTRNKMVDVFDMTYNFPEYYKLVATSVPKKVKRIETSSFDITDVLLIN